MYYTASRCAFVPRLWRYNDEVLRFFWLVLQRVNVGLLYVLVNGLCFVHSPRSNGAAELNICSSLLRWG